MVPFTQPEKVLRILMAPVPSEILGLKAVIADNISRWSSAYGPDRAKWSRSLTAELEHDEKELERLYVQWANKLCEESALADRIELLSERVHEAWMDNKRASGVTSRKLDTTDEELIVPYNQLSELAKELDRTTVRAVLQAIDSVGLRLVEKNA